MCMCVCGYDNSIAVLFVFTRFHSLSHSVVVMVKAVNLDSVPCSPSSKLRITHLTLPSSFPQLSTGVRNKNQFWPLIKVMVMGVMCDAIPTFSILLHMQIQIRDYENKNE